MAMDAVTCTAIRKFVMQSIFGQPFWSESNWARSPDIPLWGMMIKAHVAFGMLLILTGNRHFRHWF